MINVSVCLFLLVCLSDVMSQQESPLPLTDPCNEVAQRMLNIPYRII